MPLTESPASCSGGVRRRAASGRSGRIACRQPRCGSAVSGPSGGCGHGLEERHRRTAGARAPRIELKWTPRLALYRSAGAGRKQIVLAGSLGGPLVQCRVPHPRAAFSVRGPHPAGHRRGLRAPGIPSNTRFPVPHREPAVPLGAGRDAPHGAEDLRMDTPCASSPSPWIPASGGTSLRAAPRRSAPCGAAVVRGSASQYTASEDGFLGSRKGRDRWRGQRGAMGETAG